MAEKIFLHHAHLFPEERARLDKLKETMDYCSIDKAVAFAPLKPEMVTDAGLDMGVNEWLYREIKHDDNIVGFGAIDFSKGNFKDQVEEIYQYGFKGIKLHPAFQKFDMMGKEAYEVYAAAEERGLFLTFHTGLHWYRLSHYQLLYFDDIAWDFPNIRFSMEHMGGYSFFKDALAVMCNTSRSGERAFAGLTSVDDSKGVGTWSLTNEQIKDILFQTGDRRTIAGMDFPYNKKEGILRDINRIKNLDIPEESKSLILGGNLERILFGE